jgi:hypothetical protein
MRRLYKNGQPKAQGFLLENKDSYVDIIANSFAILGAKKGPAIIESADNLLSGDLRAALFENLVASDLFKGEGDNDAHPDFKKSSSVFLRSDNLIKALAKEVTLLAKNSLYGKAVDKIHIS